METIAAASEQPSAQAFSMSGIAGDTVAGGIVRLRLGHSLPRVVMGGSLSRIAGTGNQVR